MPVPAATTYTSRAARVNVRPPSRTSTTVSITDIYNIIENKNHLAKSQSKRSSIQSAQSKTIYRYGTRGRKHKTSRETQSLPGSIRAWTPDATRSRPQTAREVLSQFTYAPRTEPDDEDEEPDGYSRCLTRSDVGEYVLHASIAGDSSYLDDVGYLDSQQRHVTSFSQPSQYAASRGFCVRSRSTLLQETDGLVSSLSRQCCDVLGPKLCHECAIIKRRSRDTRRYESHLPRVEITEGNLAATLLVAKNYPHMTMEEIQVKLARGDILKPGFKYNVQRIQDSKANVTHETGFVKSTPKPNISRNINGATYNYFSSIKDLNKKIVSGQLIRKIIHTGDPQKDMAKRPVSNDLETFSESVTPSFISPRKGKQEKKRAPTNYDPPLVPKVCQNSEPFFASPDSEHEHLN